MYKILTIASAAAIALSSCSNSDRKNPLLQESYGTVYEIPPFDKIQYSDYLPAIREGMARQNNAIQAIIDNPEEPVFENTILELDNSGNLLGNVMLIFSALDEAHNTPEIMELADTIYPLVQAHSDAIYMNRDLFDKVKSVYENRDNMGLTVPQRRLTEETYRTFARNGALLDDEGKERLKSVNSRLTDLYNLYNKNLLAATNSVYIVVEDSTELSGLPSTSVAVAREEAEGRGLSGKWVFTLHSPSRLPLLTYADNRDLRRRMYEAYTNQATSGDYDNKKVINDILHARAEKARLLGYSDFASYMTENVMARTSQAAEDLLMKLWTPGVKRVGEEVAEMQTIADSEGNNFTIEPWDYYYYAEKVRKEKYDFDENDVRPYFHVDSVAQGIFRMAGKLYGITIEPLPDAPKYHPDVKVYDVKDADGNHLAVFMTDYFQRPEKRQGAWMYQFTNEYVDSDGISHRPIVYNVGNFTKPTAGQPSLLTMDEVVTMFHEFGHGLHGMLTKAQYQGQSGTSVDRDFVELPSQIHEHWAFEPEMLALYAHHYETGETIPDSLISKIQASAAHRAGFDMVERVGAALLDLDYGRLMPADGETVDTEDFEAAHSAKIGRPQQVQYRYRSPYFKHIFGSDGYASGYYTYMWAEVLDCDGFDKFKENGIFDPATASSFRENVLETGGSDDPMTLYIKFRGHEPEVGAVLRKYKMDN